MEEQSQNQHSDTLPPIKDDLSSPSWAAHTAGIPVPETLDELTEPARIEPLLYQRWLERPTPVQPKVTDGTYFYAKTQQDPVCTFYSFTILQNTKEESL
ncbi:hypothetical protein NW762_001049 [Fusarium torreyae]|uniref:Uncharacterized protein n=1 Tax=Fusarium torreyae TaxID=1237075 RepID=A0A9W8SJ28_9HYPO|nr:hypothetical protein NW762_001049 [Fusarium torreyae]